MDGSNLYAKLKIKQHDVSKTWGNLRRGLGESIKLQLIPVRKQTRVMTVSLCPCPHAVTLFVKTSLIYSKPHLQDQFKKFLQNKC